MARIKKQNIIETEQVVETPKENHSQAYFAFKAHIEQYAKSNPVKYELKKAKLLEQLNNL